MSPRWHSVAGASLHFYFSEPHARPHVAVRGKGWTCTIALDTLDVLAKNGSPPAKTLAEIIEVLTEHQDLAIRAFRETAAHRFPGTLEQMKEATDD
ncbi:MAG TPA: DUF4160 domain-containing protein [Egibacteraceae bacterium]|nr:DUF4160 domain-containing protein [Egibacteraceae bacterium]